MVVTGWNVKGHLFPHTFTVPTADVCNYLRHTALWQIRKSCFPESDLLFFVFLRISIRHAAIRTGLALHAQEMSQMVRFILRITILLINNRGYSMEVEIQIGGYNKIENWVRTYTPLQLSPMLADKTLNVKDYGLAANAGLQLSRQ